MPPVKKLVDAGELNGFLVSLLTAHNVSDKHAARMAELFTWANLRGVDSHGVSRVPRYIELFDRGEANRAPKMVETTLRPGTAKIDADFAPGAVALGRAVDLGVEMAASQGVAWVQVKHSVHAGAMGYFVEKAAKQGMIALLMLTGMPNMAYPGARAAGVATSPIAIGVPNAGGAPFLLDMATAVIAFGKIKQYALRGEALPEASAVTPEGVVTTDAEAAKWPLPLGGMKGAGLSLGFELLTSVLAGAPTLAPIHGKVESARRHRQNAAVIVLDPASFGPADAFAAAVDETLAAIRGLPRIDEAQAIGVPGDRGGKIAAERTAKGIPLPEKTLAELQSLAEAKGLAPLAVKG